MTMAPLRTLAQAIEDAAGAKTGFRFLDDDGRAEPFFTMGGIERASARFGGALQALGAKKGDRVALILADNADFVFAFLGAVRAGIVPVPIYPPSGLGKLEAYLDNTLHIVAQSGATVLITDAVTKRMLGTVAARAPSLAHVVDIETLRRAREELRPVAITLEDTCLLQFTSGSTSRPKGVVLTHENIAANVHGIARQGIGLEDGVDSGVSWLPLYHDMGLIGFVLAPIYHRTTITFLPPLEFLKRPVRWLEAISRHRGTISFGPNFAYALCVKRIKDHELAGIDLSHWRVAGCGAEPIRAENLKAFASRFSSVGFSESAFVACYGMAESTLAISFSRKGEGIVTDTVDGRALEAAGRADPCDPTFAGATSVVRCGPALEGHEARAFVVGDHESERPLREREVGEIRLRGPSVMSGYFNEPSLTRESFAGGWLKTGDLGYVASGEVHVCGRLKELIIVNGRNYYPQDLEWEAGKVEGVRKGNVVAFGTSKPSGDRERVVLCVETSIADDTGREALAREVRRAVQQATGLTLDDVILLEAGALPKTSSGKLQRSATRDLYENGALLGRGSARDLDGIEAVRELAKSQLGYAKHALLGGGKDS